jgi:integrase/recombinase XerC
MSPPRKADTVIEIYDQALLYARDYKLAPDAPRPRPTQDWPAENVALLERYREWLSSGGTSAFTIRLIYLTAAGHVLGFNLKPHAQIDLEADFRPAEEYVRAKGQSRIWTQNNLNGFEKFRRFLLHTRGQLVVKENPYEPTPHTDGLPAWVVEELGRYQKICQRNWRPARLTQNTRRFWSGHLHVWRFLVEQCGVQVLSDVRRKFLYDYAEERLTAGGNSVTTVNADLRNFKSFLVFLQEQEYVVPQALLRIRGLKQPERLPKYLTDEQVKQVRDEFEGQVAKAENAAQRRDALLTRAAFYLLWQSGLRKGEVEELLLEDLDLPGRRLSVRNGKGQKDRTVFLTDTTIHALQAYLALRGMGPTDHVFLYRNQPILKDLIHGRLKAAGEKVGVHVHAHRLRHTAATQLLNAGCPVTSIQKFLGHKKLNTTMVYAHAHDQTVEEDYFAAMSRIETRLALTLEPKPENKPVAEPDRMQLLALADQLARPILSQAERLEIAEQMRLVLTGVSLEAIPRVDLSPPKASVSVLGSVSS